MKKFFSAVVFLAVSLLLLTGCQKNQQQQTVEKLVTAVFTAPDEKFQAASDAMAAAPAPDGQIQPDALAEMEAAIRALYGDHVAEDALIDSSIYQIMVANQVDCANQAFQQQVERVEVTKNETAQNQYHYQAFVVRTQADGTKEDMAFTGTVQLDDEGKADFMSARLVKNKNA